MILGMGADLVEIARIRKSIQSYGDRFLNRIYTSAEQAYCSKKGNSAESFAARFAAKEAAMKALGTGMQGGVTWKNFEVMNEPSGRPALRLSGAALQYAESMGVKRASISITHTAGLSFAVVILENGE